MGDPSSAPIGFGPSNVKIDSSGVPKSKKKGPRLQTVIGIINRLGESTKDPRRSFRPLQGRGSGSRPVMPPPWDGTGGYPSGYRANATSTPTSSTGAPSSPIGITEGTHTLECSGCIAWGGPDKQPSVPARQVNQKAVQIITITKTRAIWGLTPAVINQIVALVQSLVNALLGQPGVTLNAVMSLNDVLLEVGVEINGIAKNFTISLKDAL